MSKEPNELEKAVISGARAGKTGRALAVEFGVSPSTVSNILRRSSDIKPKLGRGLTCVVDHTAFDTLNEASEYWLGFLSSDGTAIEWKGKDTTPAIGLQLASRDRGHLEKFREFLKSDYAITDCQHRGSFGYSIDENGVETGGKSSQIRVRSAALFEALRRHGLAEKSPLRLPSDALAASRHFWRGAVDGNGTIGRYENYSRLMLSGHMPTLVRYQAFLRACGVEANIIEMSTIHGIDLGGTRAAKMIRLLYGDATISLDRKQERANAIIALGEQ